MMCSPSLGWARTSAVSRPASSARRNAPAKPRTRRAASRRAATAAGQPAVGMPARIARRSAVTSASRRAGGRPPARRDALVTADLRAILAGMPTAGWPAAVAARRDAALLVLGFAGAFRRAELAGLDTADVRAHPSDGLHIMVRAAKNDPGRAGQVKAVPYGTEVATCGPCAWARWRGVVAAADAGGRVAVLRTVRADDPASHV